MNKIYIKGPRQQRAIEALLNGPVIVKNLGALIGALNPRQVIFELRNQGFEGIIITRRFDTIDQDGKVCHPGEYFIPQHLKPIAEKALIDYRARRHPKSSMRTSNNNRRG